MALSSVSVWVRGISRPAPKQRHTVRIQLLSGEVLPCGRCRRRLPVEFFNRHPIQQRQHWCRECFKEYFKARGSMHHLQVKYSRNRRVALARDHVLRHLKRHPCVDCGKQDVVVLEFDHVRESKVTEVSTMVRYGKSIPKLDAEIAKCDVVCANCHSRRTALRANTWRARVSRGEELPDVQRPGRVRNLAYISKLLAASACVDCGVSDVTALEFDHVGSKDFNISSGIRRGYSLQRLEAEISQCEVRCSNCHRRRTAERGGHFRFRMDTGKQLAPQSPNGVPPEGVEPSTRGLKGRRSDR